MIICLPSGIGDISWWVSKVINAPEWPEIKIEIADGWPFRAGEYLEMLGKESLYGSFDYTDILTFENIHPYKLWKEVSSSGFGKYYMQPNDHLGLGNPLKDYLPDLPTSYHYPMNIPSIKHKKYYLPLTTGNWIGISAASYRGHKAWKTWGYDEWSALIKKLVDKGYNICLMGGAWDDLTNSLGTNLPEDRCLNLIGKTSFSEVCAVHKMCKFYIGFSSGLGIIRSVMSLLTIILWPDHQAPLSMSWADPDDVETRRYIASTYMSVDAVLGVFELQEKDYD